MNSHIFKLKAVILTTMLGLAMVLVLPNLTFAADTPATNETQTEVVAESEHSTDEEHSEENSGIVGMFGLDWRLFLAQLINFGIVLFVLWKWVFGPVTKGLSDRTSKIEASLKDADKISKDREEFDDWKEGQIGEVRKQAAEILAQAKQDAEALKEQTLDQTKQEQAKLKQQAEAAIAQEQQKAIEQVQTHLSELVIGATEKILQEKLDSKKDQSLIEQALKQAGEKQ